MKNEKRANTPIERMTISINLTKNSKEVFLTKLVSLLSIKKNRTAVTIPEGIPIATAIIGQPVYK